MKYVMDDGPDEETGTDVCKLMDAWEVQVDERRVKKAVAYIQRNAMLCATIARHYQIRHGLKD